MLLNKKISSFQGQGHGMFDGLVKDSELSGCLKTRWYRYQTDNTAVRGLVRQKGKTGFAETLQLVWKPAETSTASYTEVNKNSLSRALILQRYPHFYQKLWHWLTKLIHPPAIGTLISWKRKKRKRKGLDVAAKILPVVKSAVSVVNYLRLETFK